MQIKHPKNNPWMKLVHKNRSAKFKGIYFQDLLNFIDFELKL